MSNYEPPESVVETEVDVQLNDSETDDRLVRTHTYTNVYTYYYCYSNCYVQDQLQDVPRCDQPVSPSTAISSRPASPATFEPPMKRKRKRKGSSNDVDDALLLLLKTALERRLLKDKREAEKQAVPQNPETNYGLEVAETLNRFTPRQRSLAKLRIQQVLFEIEFPN